jgi:hypothetical protein
MEHMFEGVVDDCSLASGVRGGGELVLGRSLEPFVVWYHSNPSFHV